MVGVRYRRSLFPGYSDTVEYDIMCPSGNPRVPVLKARSDREFVVPAGQTSGALRIDAQPPPYACDAPGQKRHASRESGACLEKFTAASPSHLGSVYAANACDDRRSGDLADS